MSPLKLRVGHGRATQGRLLSIDDGFGMDAARARRRFSLAPRDGWRSRTNGVTANGLSEVQLGVMAESTARCPDGHRRAAREVLSIEKSSGWVGRHAAAVR